MVVNHINHNKKNNRLDNLEVITNRENSNKKHLKSSSKFIGVYWSKSKGKWASKIYYNKKLNHIGYFEDEEDANKAYQLEFKKNIT